MYIHTYSTLTFVNIIMHSTTVRFKTLKLIHFQNKFPRGGKPKPRGANAPPAPPERNPAHYGPLLHTYVIMITSHYCMITFKFDKLAVGNF